MDGRQVSGDPPPQEREPLLMEDFLTRLLCLDTFGWCHHALRLVFCLLDGPCGVSTKA